MNRAKSIKNWARALGGIGVPGLILALLTTAALPPAGMAQVPRSRQGQDPWDQLAWLADSLPGPAALFAGGRPAPRPALWLGRQRPFDLRDLSSQALAVSLPVGGTLLSAGLHQLDAPGWRERQLLMEAQRTWRRDSRVGLGLELRQAATEDWRDHELRLRGGACWSAGPLRLAFHLQHPAPGVDSPSERGLAAACRLSKVWWLGWSLDQEGAGRQERLALGGTHGGLGLALSWRPGLGWEAAGKADWKGLSLRVAWRSHPVLPPEHAWGIAWLGAGQ
jgi:hypothetical protein